MLFKNSISLLHTEFKGIPLAVLNNDELKFLKKTYSNNKIVFEKNMRIVLYTDGLVEAVHIDKMKEGIDFEKEALFRAFLELENNSTQNFVNNVFKKLVQFRGSEEFEDDVCIICLDV